LDVKVLGAANEVGRSGFLVNCNGTNILLDYGVMFGRRGTPPRYPLHVKPKDVDAIIITHAHLDHSGNVPSLFVSGNTDVYATPPTFDLSKLLIEDMLKIEKNSHPFDLPELNNMMKNAKEIGFKHKVNVICTSIFSLHRFGQRLPNRVILLKLDLVQASYPSGS